MKIKLGHFFGLGDTLWITPIYKIFKDTETIIYDTERNRSMAFLFDGLTNIKYENQSFEPFDYHEYIFKNYGKISKEEFLYWKNYDPTHLATKLFKYLGIQTKESIIPFINPSEECISIGKDILNKIGNIKNPIIFVANNTAGNFKDKASKNQFDLGDIMAAYRTLRPDYWQEIINYYSKEYTFLQCGKDGRVFEFENVIPIYKYLKEYSNELKAITGLYSIIKKYIGVDTGDYNLMLSVGGECKVLIPEASQLYGYNGISSVFREKDYLENEKIRTEYINFSNYKDSINKKILSF